jgi:hypothetical protein
MSEVWKYVKGYCGFYKVSTHGRVKSCERIITRGNVEQPLKERILKPGKNKKTNYLIVALCKDGKSHFDYVHRLVAMAFIPNPKNLPEVNHKDLNKSNNRKSNLEWRSSKGNKKHAVARGVLFNPNPLKGEQCGASLLNERKVLKIRRLLKKGHTQTSLAMRFHTSQANISDIHRRRIWKHI